MNSHGDRTLSTKLKARKLYVWYRLALDLEEEVEALRCRVQELESKYQQEEIENEE